MNDVSMLHPSTRFYRFLVLLFASLLIFGSYFAYDIIGSIAPSIVEEMKIERKDVAGMNTAYSVAAILAVFFGGFLIDRLGVRKSSILFSILVLLGSGIVAFANKSEHVLAWIFVGRFVFGAGAEPLVVAQCAMISRWFKGKELALGFGIALTIARLGSLFAYNTGELIKKQYGGYSAPLKVAFLCCAFSLLANIVYNLLDRRGEKILAMKDQPAEDSKIRFTDITSFSRSYWYVTILCLTFYSAIFPFQNLATDFFVEKWGALFRVDDVKEPAKLVTKLRDASKESDAISHHLREKLSPELQQQIKKYKNGEVITPEFLAALVEDCNGLLKLSLYDHNIFANVELSNETKKLVAQKNQEEEKLRQSKQLFSEEEKSIRLNRLLLEDVYPSQIAKGANGSLFRVDDIKEPIKFIAKLRDAGKESDSVSHYLRGKLSPELQQQIKNYKDGEAISPEFRAAFLAAFNGLLKDALYDDNVFADVELSKETEELLGQKNIEEENSIRLNRLLLEDIYSQEIVKRKHIYKETSGEGSFWYEVFSSFLHMFSTAGGICSIIIFASMIFAPFAGHLLDKIGRRATLMIIGSLLMIPAHAVMGLTTIYPVIPMVLLGMAFVVVPAALWPSISMLVRKEAVGTAYGLTTAIQNVGLALFPLLNGTLRDYTKNYTASMMMFTGLGVVALVFSILLLREDAKAGKVLEKP